MRALKNPSRAQREEMVEYLGRDLSGVIDRLEEANRWFDSYHRTIGQMIDHMSSIRNSSEQYIRIIDAILSIMR